MGAFAHATISRSTMPPGKWIIQETKETKVERDPEGSFENDFIGIKVCGVCGLSQSERGSH
jgi:hypothetical protein